MVKKKRRGRRPARRGSKRSPTRKRPAAAVVAAAPPPANPPANAEAATAYDLKRERERLRSAATSARARDVGEIPPCANPERRAACARDVRRWCLTYVPHWFGHAWSPDLIEVAETSGRVMLEGGQQPVAMPRGGGKTTVAKAVALMAALEGYRRFLVLIAANKELAQDLLEAIKHELLTNDEIAADYPEAVKPFRNVGGIANRCAGQTHKGQPTFIEWGRSKIVFAEIEGARAAGVVIVAKGLTGGLRGLNVKGLRPDFALLDDPQTDQSARSPRQIFTRLRLIKGTVRGLAGPGREVALFAMVTVIQPGDVADQLLDPALNPDWQGRRYKLLYKFPANLELWRQYDDVRKQALRGGARGADRWKAANRFYRANRKEMDAGAVVAWKERKLPYQLSALQFAMDFYFDDEACFFAEYQNEPRPDEISDAKELKATELATKTNGLGRGVVPLWSARLTGFVDVQHELLYWVVGAYADNFTGAIVDYNAWPEQRRSYFTYRDASPKLPSLYPGHEPAAAVKAGLVDLGRSLRSRQFPREGVGTGAAPLELLLVDWGDGEMTAAIAEVCRMPEFSGWMIPARGVGLTPAARPMHEWTTRPGERCGFHWFYKLSTNFRTMSVDVDSNFWKSFASDALAAPFGNRGALTFFGGPGVRHDMLADHATSETRTRLKNEKTGRTGDVWKLKPGRPDNHFFDGLVGTAVAASMRGSSPNERPAATNKPAAPRANSVERQRVRPLF